MSDPVTNVEIEDVLSSIRRLVAEGGRTTDKTPAPAAEDTSGAAKRFVLTPALRVADAATDAPKATPKPAPLDLGTPVAVPASKLGSNRASLEQTIAELEAAVTDQHNEFEPDGSEVSAPIPFSLTRFPPLDEIESLDEVEDALETDLGEDVDEAADDALSGTALSEDDIADEEMATQAAPLDVHRLTAAALVVGDGVEDDSGDDTIHAVVDAPEVPSPAFQRHTDDAPVAQMDDDLDAYMEEETVIDEAALRELVAEILREELQGPLGERITRNVRKLVRREIQRAMSSKDLS